MGSSPGQAGILLLLGSCLLSRHGESGGRVGVLRLRSLFDFESAAKMGLNQDCGHPFSIL